MRRFGRNQWTLRLVLIAVLALNLSIWNQQIEQSSDFALTHVETAPSYAGPRASYTRDVTARKGKTKESLEWVAELWAEEVIKTDLFNKPIPGSDGKPQKEVVVKAAAQAEGCYGEHCSVKEQILYRGSGNNVRDISQFVAKAKSVLNPEIDRASGRHVTDLEEERKEEAELEEEEKKEERLEKAFANCTKDNGDYGGERGDPLTGTAKLQCQVDNLDTFDREKAEARFATLSDTLREMLLNGSTAQKAKAREMLKQVGGMGISRSITAQVRVMSRADFYQKNLKRISKMISNPYGSTYQKQMALYQLNGMTQSFNYEFGHRPQMLAAYGRISDGVLDEIGYWQGEIQQLMHQAVFNDGAGTVDTPSLSRPDSISVSRRIARRGGISEANLIYDRTNWFQNQVTAPAAYRNYLTVNPYVNRSNRTLNIPQLNDPVSI